MNDRVFNICITSGSFPILRRDELARFFGGLKAKGKVKAIDVYSYLTRAGIIGYAFGFDGTATAELSGGFMPPLSMREKSISWGNMKVTEDFKAMTDILHKDGLPFYIVTFSDPKSRDEIKSYKKLRNKGSGGKGESYFQHHFGDQQLELKDTSIDSFKKECLAGEALVTMVLRQSNISPTKILAWNPE